jgi:hypothetical protein
MQTQSFAFTWWRYRIHRCYNSGVIFSDFLSGKVHNEAIVIEPECLKSIDSYSYSENLTIAKIERVRFVTHCRLILFIYKFVQRINSYKVIFKITYAFHWRTFLVIEHNYLQYNIWNQPVRMGLLIGTNFLPS